MVISPKHLNMNHKPTFSASKTHSHDHTTHFILSTKLELIKYLNIFTKPYKLFFLNLHNTFSAWQTHFSSQIQFNTTYLTLFLADVFITSPSQSLPFRTPVPSRSKQIPGLLSSAGDHDIVANDVRDQRFAKLPSNITISLVKTPTTPTKSPDMLASEEDEEELPCAQPRLSQLSSPSVDRDTGKLSPIFNTTGEPIDLKGRKVQVLDIRKDGDGVFKGNTSFNNHITRKHCPHNLPLHYSNI